MHRSGLMNTVFMASPGPPSGAPDLHPGSRSPSPFPIGPWVLAGWAKGPESRAEASGALGTLVLIATRHAEPRLTGSHRLHAPESVQRTERGKDP